MKRVVYFGIGLLLLWNASAKAQTIAPFKKGDRIVFVGNSITHGGRYHADIWLYYMTRFPNRPITIFNGGIGGEIAVQMAKRMETDIYAKRPSVIALTFGMNDTGYFEFLQSDSAEKTRQRLEASFQALRSMDSSFKRHPEIRKIIIAGSPYDETSRFGTNNLFPGKSNAMLKTAVYQEEIAKKSGWDFVDFFRPMTAINLLQQKQDSTYTLIGNDRIHPGVDGHLVMAYLFLKAQGLANHKVADFTIDARSSKATAQENCRIDAIRSGAGKLEFDYLARALPFPLDTTPTGEWGAMQRRETEALKVIPFTREMNQELLRVIGLTAGRYAVEMDGQQIGVWSNRELNTGINLALIRRTPQYEQAMAIKRLNDERWQIERRLRDYAWMEYDFLMDKGLLMKDDLATVDTIYAHLNEGFVRGNLDNYLKARYPEVRRGWQRQMDVLTEEIYRINQPKSRHFLIRKLN